YVQLVCFDGVLLAVLSVVRIINDDDDVGVIRNSRGRFVRDNIEPSVVEKLCENSQRGLRDNGVEQRGYKRPKKEEKESNRNNT
ncbi:unnamed protein product, partial [Onchocerca ochengi]